MMTKIAIAINVILFIMPCILFGQSSVEQIESAMKIWTFEYNGNPIDGFTRRAFRMSNEQDVNDASYMLEVGNLADSIVINNSIGSGGNDRDDVYMLLKTTTSFDGLDKILMYFDNENIYYNVNYRKYAIGGLLLRNAISGDGEEYLSRFSFIEKLKQRNVIYFRFIYSSGEQINASFTLNGSTSALNKVVDLSNIEDDDYIMDAMSGIFALGAFLNSDEVARGLGVYLDSTLSKVVIKYLDDSIGQYASTYIINYQYNKDDRSISCYNLDDKLTAIIPYEYLNIDNAITNKVMELLYYNDYSLGKFGSIYELEQFLETASYSEKVELFNNIEKSIGSYFRDDFSFWDYISPLWPR